MIHLSRSAPRVALLVGLAVASLGAAGCTVTAEPVSPAAYVASPPEPGVGPAPRPAPPPRRAEVDPAFRQAVAEYGRQVREVRFAPEYQQQREMSRALRQLADALEMAPFTGRRAEVAAARLRQSAAVIGAEAGAQADSREVREALEESLDALERIARQHYRRTGEVWGEVEQMERWVQEVRPRAPIRRQSDAIVGALGAAEGVLRSMIVAVDRGDLR
ncbi:MAG TPA: hypothetical protein VLS89_14330 [Candidatus Nanopelagicales bacterium]|nr:hypothetical protein [Candidatus Nanopelagicales bacterium]